MPGPNLVSRKLVGRKPFFPHLRKLIWQKSYNNLNLERLKLSYKFLCIFFQQVLPEKCIEHERPAFTFRGYRKNVYSRRVDYIKHSNINKKIESK